MATPEKRTRTSSKQQPDGTEKVITTVTWLARWRDPDGRQRKQSFAKRSDAARHLAAMEADKARGVYVDGSDPTTVTAAA
jgi:hypothetical protein